MKKIILTALCAALLLSGCKARSGGQPGTESASSVAATEESSATENATENAIYSVAGKKIVIDAGHGISSYKANEPVAPNASETKLAFSGGTSGANQTEEELNLEIALKVCSALEEMGAEVYMTRTQHESDMTNIDRAKLANDVGADLAVRIHADGNDSSSLHGASMLVPGEKYITDENLIEKSRNAGECVLEEFIAATGAQNRGIFVRNDLTGFNWSQVPVILIEVGFMTNPEEDKLMETEEYKEKMANRIVNGIEKYFASAK